MKAILNAVPFTATADKEEANYPAGNLTDNHPKKRWLVPTAEDTATATIDASGTMSGFALFGIQADHVSIAMNDPNACEWGDGIEWEEGTEWATFEVTPTFDFIQSQYGDAKAIFSEFDQFSGSAQITVTVTRDSWNTDLQLAAGVFLAGTVIEAPDPDYGLQERLIDFSIEKELMGGGLYYKQRDIVREFSGVFEIEYGSKYYQFMLQFARKVGKKPTAWRIVDALGFEWVVYGRFVEMPVATYPYYNRVQVEITIREVL